MVLYTDINWQVFLILADRVSRQAPVVAMKLKDVDFTAEQSTNVEDKVEDEVGQFRTAHIIIIIAALYILNPVLRLHACLRVCLVLR